MSALETIRNAIPTTLREQLYTYVAAGVFLISGLGYISDTVAALWVAVAVASVTHLFAVLHSLSPRRTALYGFLAALVPLDRNGVGMGSSTCFRCHYLRIE